MRRVRLIIEERGAPAYWNMAVDEALLELSARGRGIETLRLYIFRPHAVTIGYFQRIREVVNLEAAQRLGVDVVRRFTGGGAVYHDPEGEVTYSYSAPLTPGLRDVARSYRIICMGIVEAARLLGVTNVEFVPVNDVVANGRKFSGSAQGRRGEWLLQHGTFMYATDLDRLAELLVAPREKLASHGVRAVRQRVTTISEVLHREVTRDEVVRALVKGFEKALGIELEEGELTEEELRLAEELSEKYRSAEWNFRR